MDNVSASSLAVQSPNLIPTQCFRVQTGFTGQFIARRLAAASAAASRNREVLSVGIAGRSRERLTSLRDSIVAAGMPAPQLIIADVADAASLRAMAARGKVLINAVGPFRFFGEAVVAACIAERCDYVDITGEPAFMEQMVNKYDAAAKAAGVIVCNTAAFDSIPADIGAAKAASLLRSGGFLPTSVVAYLTLQSTHPKGVGGHFATFESAVHGVGSTSDLGRIRKDYAAAHPAVAAVPSYGGKLLGARDGALLRKPFFWSKEVGKWVVPFPGSDASVVRRTQRSNLLLRLEDKPAASAASGAGGAAAAPGASSSSAPPEVIPIGFSTFATLPSTWSLVLMLLYGALFMLLARFGAGRKLLLRFPGLFSNGVFSHAGPDEAQIAATSFTYRFVAVGHKGEEAAAVLARPRVRARGKAAAAGAAAAATADASPSSASLPPATARAVLEVRGREPGYDATSNIVSCVALTLLKERAAGSLPGRLRGGVFTPAVVFAEGSPAGGRLTRMLEESGALSFVTLEAPHVAGSGSGAAGSSGSAAAAAGVKQA